MKLLTIITMLSLLAPVSAFAGESSSPSVSAVIGTKDAKQIRVDGKPVVDGAQILSGSSLETTKEGEASVTLSNGVVVRAFGGTTVRLSYDAGTVSASAIAGCVSAFSDGKTVATVVRPDGTANSTSPGKQLEVNSCDSGTAVPDPSENSAAGASGRQANGGVSPGVWVAIVIGGVVGAYVIYQLVYSPNS